MDLDRCERGNCVCFSDVTFHFDLGPPPHQTFQCKKHFKLWKPQSNLAEIYEQNWASADSCDVLIHQEAVFHLLAMPNTEIQLFNTVKNTSHYLDW